MEIDTTTLRRLVESAFDIAYNDPDAERDATVKLLMDPLGPEGPEPPEQEYRIWTVAELRELPDGTMFEHGLFGIGRLVSRDKEKVVAFNNPAAPPQIGLNHDQYPWDTPMRRIAG